VTTSVRANYTCDCCQVEISQSGDRFHRTGIGIIYCNWCYGHCGSLTQKRTTVAPSHNFRPEEVVSDDDFEEYREKLLEKKVTPLTVKELLVLLFNQQPDALVVWQDEDGVLRGLAQVLADGGPVVKMRGL
jgi:hypothetical protein